MWRISLLFLYTCYGSINGSANLSHVGGYFSKENGLPQTTLKNSYDVAFPSMCQSDEECNIWGHQICRRSRPDDTYGFCSCPPSRPVLYSQQCFHAITGGGKCVYSEQCMWVDENSVCEYQMCACKYTVKDGNHNWSIGLGVVGGVIVIILAITMMIRCRHGSRLQRNQTGAVMMPTTRHFPTFPQATTQSPGVDNPPAYHQVIVQTPITPPPAYANVIVTSPAQNTEGLAFQNRAFNP